MKTSLACAALLCGPEVFAVALPHIPKLNSRWYHKDELDTNDAIHAKRGISQDHGGELKPRQAGGPSSAPITTETPTLATTTGPSGTGNLGILPLPAATLHNPFVGNHPFIGHGPVIRLPTGTPSTSSSYQAYNFTATYNFTGTTPPIANATATIYVPPIVYPVSNSSDNVTSCDSVPELVDGNGNFLPGDLQPKYNGSVKCVQTTYAETEPEVDEYVVEGHVVGDEEVVEVEITPLPYNATSWNSTTDEGNYGTYYGANPTGYIYPTGTNLPLDLISSTGTYLPLDTSSAFASTTSTASLVGNIRTPSSSTPGFTGPKVRRGELSERQARAYADLDFE